MKLDPDRYQAIKLNREGRVLTVTLNRPERRNAVNEQLHDELACIFYDIAMDDEVGVVVLTGAQNAFCAGGDIDWLEGMRADPEAFERTAMRGKRIIHSLLDLDRPVIARVNGHAVGLGATLALFSDIIFMARDAVISDPHVRVGVVAGDGGALIWPQLIGFARAKEYLFTGDAVTAEDAERMGLINHAVDPDALDEAVEAFVRRLDAGPLKAIRYTKAAANIPLKQMADAAMDAALAYEMATTRTHDHGEALAAFRAKREPRFQGR